MKKDFIERGRKGKEYDRKRRIETEREERRNQ